MPVIPIINRDTGEIWKEFNAKVEEPRSQRRIILFIVCVALLLDNMLYMVIVPIIPDYLRRIGAWDTHIEGAEFEYRNVSNKYVPYRIGGTVVYEGEDSAVGMLFASKAIVQLFINPFSGAIIDRIGYDIPMMIGLGVMFFSTAVFACGQSYGVLFLARSLQGVGSAFADTAGMAMIAHRFTEENERQRALAMAIAFISFGSLVAPPFGGVLYQIAGKEVPFIILSLVCLVDALLLKLVMQPEKDAEITVAGSGSEKTPGTPIHTLLMDPGIACCAGALVMANVSLAFLEPTISLWMEDNMHVEEWQMGLVWLPAFIPHVLGVYSTVALAETYPRYQWLFAAAGLAIEGFCSLLVPFATSFWALIIPISGICYGIALVDTSLLPTLGYLVDLRYVSVYGSIYAIADISYSLAYAVGPVIAGSIVESIGFTALNVFIAISNILYVPVLASLRKVYDYEQFEPEQIGMTERGRITNVGAFQQKMGVKYESTGSYLTQQQQQQQPAQQNLSIHQQQYRQYDQTAGYGGYNQAPPDMDMNNLQNQGPAPPPPPPPTRPPLPLAQRNPFVQEPEERNTSSSYDQQQQYYQYKKEMENVNSGNKVVKLPSLPPENVDQESVKGKSGEGKSEGKKAEEKKAEDKKSDDKKAQNKDAKDVKLRDSKADERKSEERKSEERKSEERKSDETKCEKQKPETDRKGSKWLVNLAKPPVPQLKTTLERYLSGLEAVLTPEKFEETKRLVKEFGMPQGEGQHLQKLLQEYAENTDNWITDIWLDDMYLANPIPLPVNSNPFFLLPHQTFRSLSEQLHFAAAFVHFSLEFNIQTRDQTLSQDYGKGQKSGQALCMETYRHFFTACRLPGKPRDTQKILARSSGHFIVAAFNQFFKVTLSDKADPRDIPSFDHIAATLHHVWEEARTNKNPVKIGLFTTQNRREWAVTHEFLMKDPINGSSLKAIEDSLFILCLDDFVPAQEYPQIKREIKNSVAMKANDLSYQGALLLHGGGSQVHTSNRWFDKFLQIIVSKSGVCGAVVEHSVSEGITVIRYLELFFKHFRKCWPTFVRQNTVDMEHSVPPAVNALRYRKLEFVLDERLNRQLKNAAVTVDRLIADLDFYVLRFDGFGSQFIKDCGISPDVFMQLSLQLTFFKLHQNTVSTYESCSLRQFRRGRVDNIRASHKAAKDWCIAMYGSDDEREKIETFKNAIAHQTIVLKYTASGHGPDNHLIALSKMSEIYEEKIPALFRSECYKEYMNFRLSTSQLGSTEDVLVGYGPVVPDGYGACYLPRSDLIYFCISSFISSNDTERSEMFAKTLECSLNQMKELCEMF